MYNDYPDMCRNLVSRNFNGLYISKSNLPVHYIDDISPIQTTEQELATTLDFFKNLHVIGWKIDPT